VASDLINFELQTSNFELKPWETSMGHDTTAVVALKNAWNGTLAAADRLRELAPAVQAIGDETALGQLDFETYRAVTLAQANAAEALRGLVEELQRKATD